MTSKHTPTGSATVDPTTPKQPPPISNAWTPRSNITGAPGPKPPLVIPKPKVDKSMQSLYARVGEVLAAQAQANKSLLELQNISSAKYDVVQAKLELFGTEMGALKTQVALLVELFRSQLRQQPTFVANAHPLGPAPLPSAAPQQPKPNKQQRQEPIRPKCALAGARLAGVLHDTVGMSVEQAREYAANISEDFVALADLMKSNFRGKAFAGVWWWRTSDVRTAAKRQRVV